jgi:acetyl-CoA carboxylase carboxyl transferase subunit alpha
MQKAQATKYRLEHEVPIQEAEARLAEMEARLGALRATDERAAREAADQVRGLRREITGLMRTIYAGLTPWEIVKVARCEARPQTRDYIRLIFDNFIELHGDRAVGDDQAIVTGMGTIEERKVMLVGHQKGRNLSDRLACNFGQAHPEGYRKAIQKMRLAEKLGLPIVCLIDTPGAYPGIGAEERGQAAVIAENILAMSGLRTPIVCVVIGEGGSGGALGIAVGDRIAMMEFAYYSVITPEGCATILWKGREHAARAAEALKMTSRDLMRMGIIDQVLIEPIGGAHRDHREAASNLKSFLVRSIRQLSAISVGELLSQRYEKFRRIGVYQELASESRNGHAEEASGGVYPSDLAGEGTANLGELGG